MQLGKVTDQSDFDIIEKIYSEAFPDNERAPMKMLKKRAKQGRADFLGIYDGIKPIGMCYVVCCGDLAYLFYIAVERSLRGSGFGTKAMRALLEKYRGKRFFLALEQLDKTSDNYSQRVKRHEFYRSCGLYDLPFKLKEGTVTFAAMGARIADNGKSESFDVKPGEYKELTNRYLGFFMKNMVDMRLLPDKEP